MGIVQLTMGYGPWADIPSPDEGVERDLILCVNPQLKCERLYALM